MRLANIPARIDRLEKHLGQPQPIYHIPSRIAELEDELELAEAEHARIITDLRIRALKIERLKNSICAEDRKLANVKRQLDEYAADSSNTARGSD